MNGGWLDSVCLQAPSVNSGAVPEPESQQPTNDESDAPDAPAAFGSGTAWRSRALHLFALSGFAVAQPLLGLLGGEPGFWIARQATYLDAALLLLVVVVVLPGILFGIERAIALVNSTAAWVFHLLAVAGFTFLVSLNVIDTVTSGEMQGRIVLAAAGVVGILLTAMYARFNGVRDFVSLLAVGPVVFGVLFLFGLPPLGGTDADVVDAGIDSSTPVVLVTIDEFQLAAILGEDGSIDRTRYPNLGRLADTATFYPNATGVHDNSLKAVPAILSGQYPLPDQQAIAADFPLSIFTVLGGTHEMRVNEHFTQVCPESLCEPSRSHQTTTERLTTLGTDSTIVYLHTVVPTRLRYRLPQIGTRWEGFLTVESAEEAEAEEIEATEAGPIEQELAALTGSETRAVDYGEFLDWLNPELGPTLYYLHVDLPHAPWSYLPSGKRYPYADHILGYTPEGIWGDDPWYTQQAYERFILNTGFTDQLIGRTLDRLDELDMLDEVMLIVLSDHGENFEVNESRRALTDETFAAIAGMPLFVKYPGQTAGVLDDRNAQTIDVLPTVVEVLGGSVEGFDGVSLLAEEPPLTKRLLSNQGKEFTLSLDEYRVLAAEFAAEAHASLPPGVGFSGIIEVAGPRSDLNGLAVEDFELTTTPGSVTIATQEFINKFDPEGFFDPIAIPADVTIADGSLPQFFAIAVNGTIRSTISAYEAEGGTAALYAIIPPDSYVAGANNVEVFGIIGGPGETKLQRFS